MKITLNSSVLLKKLQVLGSVIGTNNSLPILDNFLFESENEILKITASDLETTISTTISIQEDFTFSIAVPAKLLIETLKSFPEQPLVFDILENNTIEITSTYGKYNIAYFLGEQFPKSLVLESPLKETVPAIVLLTAINKTVLATGNDDLRPQFSGVFFQFLKEGLLFAATNGHKLIEYSFTESKSENESKFIMPRKTLNVLKGILGNAQNDISIEFNDHNAVFLFEKYVLKCQLIDAQYPNYKAVIPKENPNQLIVDRLHFLNSVKSVSIFSTKDNHQVRLRIKGNELNISAEDIDYSNKAEERLTCQYTGQDIQIGFNSKYLIELLSNVSSEQIMLETSLPNRAGILTPIVEKENGHKILMLLMPSLIK